MLSERNSRDVGRCGQCALGAFSILFGVLAVQLFALPSWSHGPRSHSETNQGHMETMRSIKARVPQDLRNMDRPPLSDSEAARTTGRALFRDHCGVCHGVGGRGDGPAAPGMRTRPSDFMNLEHSNMYGVGEKFWIITHGAEETGMPGFGTTLSDEERWSLVLHILSLQREAED